MKKVISILLALVLIVCLFSCSVKTEEERAGFVRIGEEEIYPEYVLLFNGKKVLFDEFRYCYLNYRDMHLAEDEAYFEREGAEETLKEEVLQFLLSNWAVRFLAETHKISLTRAETAAVNEEIDALIEESGGKDAFAAALRKQYMTESFYRSLMRYYALYKKTFDALFAEGSPEAWSDEEFYAYYQEHYLSVQEIYIAFEAGESPENCPKTEERIRAVHAEALAGQDFWKLVEKYGEDPNMEKNPAGYYFTRGQAEEALYLASKALAENEVSAPVRGSSGYYIIKRVPMTQAKMEENKSTALYGYEDSYGASYGGAYEDAFAELYEAVAKSITVEFWDKWDQLSTKTVQ